MQLSISSKTIPSPGQTPGTRLEWGKNPPLGQSLCTKRLPRDKTGSQRPHPRDKVRKFHKCIYKLSPKLFEMKSFVVSTNKTVFQ